MGDRHGSARAMRFAADLRAAAEALISVLETIDGARWGQVPGPGVWSVGKESIHVAEGAALHLWMVRLTIGERVGSRRPGIERRELTTDLTPRQAIDLIRQRIGDGANLIAGLTDDQLALPTRPPRARAPLLADTIEATLIGHIDTHRREIERKADLGC